MGLPPEAWRLEADADSESCLTMCQAELATLKHAFQGRRRLEYRRTISYAVRLREYMRSTGKLKRTIRSITCTHVGSIPLEEIVARQQWAEGQAPLLSNPHKTPEEIKDLEGIHKDIRLEDKIPYDPFRALYTKWILPKDRLVRQDDPEAHGGNTAPGENRYDIHTEPHPESSDSPQGQIPSGPGDPRGRPKHPPGNTGAMGGSR